MTRLFFESFSEMCDKSIVLWAAVGSGELEKAPPMCVATSSIIVLFVFDIDILELLTTTPFPETKLCSPWWFLAVLHCKLKFEPPTAGGIEDAFEESL